MLGAEETEIRTLRSYSVGLYRAGPPPYHLAPIYHLLLAKTKPEAHRIHA